MGNQQSTQAKEENRRSNRLSKPLTKKLALSSPQLSREEFESSEFGSGLIGWENPWVGSTISDLKSYPDTRTRELSNSRFESTSTVPAYQQSIKAPITLRDPQPPRHALATSVAAKRASQPVISSTKNQESGPSQHPRRANSVQISLQRHESVIYESPIEDAASSNTHFTVGNQRFSLIRRRSLLTRPGVATRRTTGAIRRAPSPIGEPEIVGSASTFLDWSLPQRPTLDTTFPRRPTSPADARYTQLGALKLGSLRVVNGAASPCPSERIPLERCTDDAGLGRGNSNTTGPQAMGVVPIVSEISKPDDTPGSPFSFEKSPVISVPLMSKALFTRELEDEGIAMCDDSREKNLTELVLDHSPSRSVDKSDSGYSSAASCHSDQRSRKGTSLDSQLSVSAIADDKSPQRRQNGQEGTKPGNFSLPNPSSSRWYDGNGPNVLVRPGRGLRRSTLCAPRYSEYRTQNDTMESKKSSSPPGLLRKQALSTEGPLYADYCPVSTFDTPYSSSSSTMLERTRTTSGTRGANDRSESRMHRRSTSDFHLDQSLKRQMEVSHSRSRSRTNGRVWSQRPGVEVPPLPTILSPGLVVSGEDSKEDSAPPQVRGRTRSRSQDYRRRKLTKEQPQPPLPTTTSITP